MTDIKLIGEPVGRLKRVNKLLFRLPALRRCRCTWQPDSAGGSSSVSWFSSRTENGMIITPVNRHRLSSHPRDRERERQREMGSDAEGIQWPHGRRWRDHTKLTSESPERYNQNRSGWIHRRVCPCKVWTLKYKKTKQGFMAWFMKNTCWMQ